MQWPNVWEVRLMAALRSRCGHYILLLWLLSSFFPRLFSAVAWMSTMFPHMVWPLCEFRMQAWNVLHAARWNTGRKKIAIYAPSHNFVGLYDCIFATKACIDNRKKNLLNSNICSTRLHNMANFSPLTAEIRSVIWGTPSKRVSRLGALLHGTPVVGVSQTCWTESAAYIRQGGHHVGHWPTF